MEILLEILGEACCQAILAGGLDVLAGWAGVKSYQARAKSKNTGEEQANEKLWFVTFWIALPFAVGMTVFWLYMVITK